MHHWSKNKKWIARMDHVWVITGNGIGLFNQNIFLQYTMFGLSFSILIFYLNIYYLIFFI